MKSDSNETKIVYYRPRWTKNASDIDACEHIDIKTFQNLGQSLLCFLPSTQAIPSIPSNSKPVKQRHAYRQGVAKCASTMLGPLRLDLIMTRTCSRFAWLIVQRQKVISRVVWCLGPPTYIRILGNASEKLLYPPKVSRCALRMTCALQIDLT